MSFSIYDASVPVFRRNLLILQSILGKASRHAAAQGWVESEMLAARLAPDMLPLLRQVQIVSDAAKAGAFRLAGQTPPPIGDEEQGFADLDARLGRTIKLLATLTPADYEGREDAIVSFSIRGHEFSYSGRDYLNQFAMPNFYFHQVTAYAILRHLGVPLGKPDFLGARLIGE